MPILSLFLVLALAGFSAFAQQNPDASRAQRKAQRPAATEKEPLSDIEKMDNLVRMVAAGHAVHGALAYFVEFFEKRAAAIHDQAEAAYRHRLERKQMDKKYRVEIEYSYYKAMSETIKDMEAPQAVIDAATVQPNAAAPQLAKAKAEWNALAARLVSIQKRSPLRNRGATASPSGASRDRTSATNSGVAAK